MRVAVVGGVYEKDDVKKILRSGQPLNRTALTTSKMQQSVPAHARSHGWHCYDHVPSVPSGGGQRPRASREQLISSSRHTPGPAIAGPFFTEICAGPSTTQSPRGTGARPHDRPATPTAYHAAYTSHFDASFSLHDNSPPNPARGPALARRTRSSSALPPELYLT